MITPTSAPALPAGSALLWPPKGAGDFADLAWVVGEALGNGPGVRGLDVFSRRDVLYARVWSSGPEYVASLAAQFGWEVYVPDAAYATTWGLLAGVKVSVSWVAPDRDPVEEPDECRP